ncbi:MAG TPA: FtsW/RodA/SpoVE family cell cycle protein [Phycisphaerae bacterium]|nr:FtsW/RodA/SpoVE family cell cycle protein [Phycisphaerae bacterium]
MKRPVYALTQPGWAIVLAVLVLLGGGIASILASNTVPVGRTTAPSEVFAIKQAVIALVSACCGVVILRVGYLRIARHAYLIFGACMVLLVPMIVAKKLGTTLGGLVPASRGAYRWIELPGFQLQPSELMKIGYILALAWYLRYRHNYRRFSGLLLPFLISLVPMAMILAEPDLGTVLLFFPILFGMLFVAGAKIKHLLLIIALGLACVPVLWMKMHPYQRSRVVAVALQSESLRERMVKNPKKYAFTGFDRRDVMEWEVSSGMQLVRSKAALGSGGFLGQGWGHGTYVEYNFLPDRHNDFVFAIVGHQWGFVGCLVVLLCYGVIVVAGVEIATVTAEPLGRLVAMGVVSLIAAQALINLGMTVGLMPVTGMTLPFVSYGGTSLVTNFIAIALLVSVSQHRPFMLAKKPFEWQKAEARSQPA